MAWVEEVKPLMRNMGYDPDKLWREMARQSDLYWSGDKFLRDNYPDIWNAWKTYRLVVKGEKLE